MAKPKKDTVSLTITLTRAQIRDLHMLVEREIMKHDQYSDAKRDLDNISYVLSMKHNHSEADG